MNVIEVFLIFILSLLFLLLSANFFIKYAVFLSYSLKLSPLVIGATIVALGTSLPELFVTISSLLQSVPSLSYGNLIGSNILNVCLVFGTSIIFFPVRIGTTKTQKGAILLLLITLFFILPQIIILFSNQTFSLILLFLAAISLILQIYWGKRGSNHEDYRMILNHQKDKKPKVIISLITLFFSLFFLLVSSEVLVWSSLKIVQFFSLSKEFFGLTIIALGTSLPELVTTVTAGLRREEKLLAGNILGSNIFNLLFIGGLIMGAVSRRQEGHYKSLFFLFLSTLILFLIIKIYKGKNVPKIFGFILLTLYLIYLFTILPFHL